MSDDHHQGLRAWRAAPEDPEAVAAVVGSCSRLGLRLPLELDLDVQIPSLAEGMHNTYALLNASGYDYVVACSRLEDAPPFDDLLTLQSAISHFADEGMLRYSCLGVSGVHEVEALNLSNHVNGARPEIYEAFDALKSRAKRVLRSFPSARFFSVHADYPDNGQVYWNITQIVFFPNFSRSYLIVMQHFW